MFSTQTESTYNILCSQHKLCTLFTADHITWLFLRNIFSCDLCMCELVHVSMRSVHLAETAFFQKQDFNFCCQLPSSKSTRHLLNAHQCDASILSIILTMLVTRFGLPCSFGLPTSRDGSRSSKLVWSMKIVELNEVFHWAKCDNGKEPKLR